MQYFALRIIPASSSTKNIYAIESLHIVSLSYILSRGRIITSRSDCVNVQAGLQFSCSLAINSNFLGARVV